jgi:3-methyladenine DNA glycosylase/8-oxoguanine DNA glycosylase
MTATSLAAARRHLRRADPVLAALMDQHAPFGGAERRSAPYFHILVQSIINQQLSVQAGRTIGERVRRAQGGQHFRAADILRLGSARLRACGLSANKVEYIRGLARAVTGGELRFRTLVRADDDTVRNALTRYPGIGQWSADMFLMFALGRPDVLPVGDLVLRKSMQRHYRLPADARAPAYLEVAEPWRPYRTIASRYLWAATQ